MKPGRLKRGEDDDDEHEGDNEIDRSEEQDSHNNMHRAGASVSANSVRRTTREYHDRRRSSRDSSSRERSSSSSHHHHQSKRRKIKSSSSSSGNKSSSKRSSSNSHRSSREVAAAAAAVARPDASSSSAFDDSLVRRLLDLVKGFFEDGSADADISPEMVQQLLEASSGNVDLAATFFWDQYVASGINRQQQDDNDNEDHKKRRKRKSSSSYKAESRAARGDSEENHSHDDVAHNEGGVRRIRRSLLGRFDRSENRNGDDDEDDDEIVGRPVAAAEAAVAENNVEVDGEPAAAAAQIPNIEGAAADAVAGSVSVSDDEGGGGTVYRMERRRRESLRDGIRRNIGIQNNNENAVPAAARANAVPAAHVNAVPAIPANAIPAMPLAPVGGLRRNVSMGGEVPPPQPLAVANHVIAVPAVANAEQAPGRVSDDPDNLSTPAASIKQEVADNDDDNDETYLSDDDWLTRVPRTASAPMPLSPLAVLWGVPSSLPADDEADVDAVEDEQPDPPTPTIPLTWIHASFNMAPDGGGLVTKVPSEDDVALYRWKQQQSGAGNDSRNLILPPHHCKSVTAILAVVNATMLTGASIQGNRVDCSSGRKPFAELTERERIKEFESRLVDALAALLFVALKASTARKQKALAARDRQCHSNKKKQSPDFYRMQHQQVARKLRLCPTCRWQEDATTGEARLPDRSNTKSVRLVASFTNISDLKSHIKSNMRSFTGRGGCALLLETIVRIHGKGTVERMVRKSRRKNGSTAAAAKGCSSLITCTCNERQSTIRPPRQAGNAANTPVLDTTPPGHECLSVELLSLLICGQVHSTFKGAWPKQNPLGFGILSNVLGQVGAQLKHPRQPVWILRGETSHTILWVDALKMPFFDIMQLNAPGTVLQLSHWNFWYNQRNLSRMRLITAQGKWSPPTLTHGNKENGVANTTVQEEHGIVVDRIVKEKRQARQLAVIVSAGEQEDETTANVVTDSELDQVIVNNDDQSFYPKEHRRWRYKFEEPNHVTDDKAWRGYHSLSERERLVVEVKLAPRINPILWSRWPNSVVDKFAPENEPLPIV